MDVPPTLCLSQKRCKTLDAFIIRSHCYPNTISSLGGTYMYWSNHKNAHRTQSAIVRTRPPSHLNSYMQSKAQLLFTVRFSLSSTTSSLSIHSMYICHLILRRSLWQAHEELPFSRGSLALHACNNNSRQYLTVCTRSMRDSTCCVTEIHTCMYIHTNKHDPTTQQNLMPCANTLSNRGKESRMPLWHISCIQYVQV